MICSPPSFVFVLAQDDSNIDQFYNQTKGKASRAMETSELYQQYKSEFVKNCELLETMNAQENPTLYHKTIKQIDLLLKHISIEMCSLSSRQTAEEMGKIQPLKKIFMKHKKQWEAKQSKLLFSNSDANNGQDIADQNQKLSESKKLLYDMEDLSTQINSNLHKQTEQVQGATSKVKQANQILSKANKLVDRMLSRENRRANAVRCTLITIAIIVISLKFCCY